MPNLTENEKHIFDKIINKSLPASSITEFPDEIVSLNGQGLIFMEPGAMEYKATSYGKSFHQKSSVMTKRMRTDRL